MATRSIPGCYAEVKTPQLLINDRRALKNNSREGQAQNLADAQQTLSTQNESCRDMFDTEIYLSPTSILT